MTISKEIFKAPDKFGTADQLMDHIPQGDAWLASSIDGTVFRGLVVATAYPFNLFQVKLEDFICEYDIRSTTKFIDEWEKSVGLPDDCLGPADENDIQTRRNAVIERYRKIPIVTLAELQAYVDSIFGEGKITLFNGTQYFNFERTFQGTFLGDINEKFVIVVEMLAQGPFFEHDLEGTFTGALDTSKIECVLRRVIPANVLIIFDIKDPIIVGSEYAASDYSSLDYAI